MSNSATIPKARLGYIDFVRFICIFLIIIGHTWAEAGTTVFVFMFMLISGYLWTDGRKLVPEATRKIPVLITPYFAWGIPLLAVLIIQLVFFAHESTSTTIKTVASVVWGGEKAKAPFTAFWYFTAIWFSGIFYRFIRNSRKTVYFAGVLLSLMDTATIGSLLANLPLDIGIGIGVAFCSIVFYAVGHWWRIFENSKSLSVRVSVILCVISVLIISFGFVRPMVLKSGEFGTPVLSIIIYCLLGVTWLTLSKNIFKVFESWFTPFMSWVVSLATPVILLHQIPIWFWHNVGWAGKDSISKIVLFIVSVVFAFSLAAGAKYLLPRTVSKWLVP